LAKTIPHLNCGKAEILAFRRSNFHKTFWQVGVTFLAVFMVQYYLPLGMRYSTLEERQQFYTEEFSTPKIDEWFGDRLGRTKFAVIMGKHTKIFLDKYREDAQTTIIIDEYKDLADVQAQILDFLPEAVYYDRNIYDADGEKTGQELAFDLDPENVICPVHGTLEDKLKRLQGLSFCELELEIVRKEAIELYEFLQRRFSDLRVVYSGRGFHLHVLDKDAYSWSTDERLALAKEAKQAGFHIDEWVSSGEYRLIRLPYSLNGLVSRVVLPLKKEELESFDAVHDRRCVPQFLAEATF
jgi:DNA primase catalytic subunit